MLKHFSLSLVLTGLVASSFATMGCAEKGKVSTLPKSERTSASAAPTAPASPGGSVSAGPSAPKSPIFFAFDSDQLTPDSLETLKLMATYLRANPAAMLTVEGHCDETGSSEYNLSLGDRRARAAREYLKKLGVEDTRLNSISYGEEKPAVAGTDDKANEQNRRGQFDLKAG